MAVIGSDNGTITDATVVIGCLPVPTRLEAVEAQLQGGASTADAIEAATAGAGEGLEPLSDPDASSEYRRAMASVVAKRAVMEAVGGHNG